MDQKQTEYLRDRYPLTYMFLEAVGHYEIDLEILTLYRRRRHLITEKAAQVLMQTLGDVVMIRILDSINARRQTPVYIPMDARLPLHRLTGFGSAVHDVRGTYAILCLHNNLCKESGWFVMIGTLWELLWDNDVFNRLGDDAEVTPDRMEEVLEYFVKRTMDRIPMEVMAKYIPAAS